MSIRQDPKYKTWFFRFTRNGRSYFKGGYRTSLLAKEAEASFFDQVVTEEAHPERKGRNFLFKEAVDLKLLATSPNKKTAYIDKARLGLAAQYFKNQKMVEIRAEDIETFLEELPVLRHAVTPRLKGLSGHTKNHYLASIRGLYAWLMKRDYYTGPNPSMLVSFRQVPKARVRFLYPAEEMLLSPVVANDPVLWPYYFMALHTGMRISELRAIRIKDIDLVLNQLFVPNSKTSRSRYVPLSPNVTTFLAEVNEGKDPEGSLFAELVLHLLTKAVQGLLLRCGYRGIAHP
jgi:integrase